MEDEVKKLAENEDLTQTEKDNLVKEKYNIVFKPMLFILEKVNSNTDQSTGHNSLF